MSKIKGMKLLDKTAYVLACAGAVNVGTSEFLNFNLVDWALGLANLGTYTTWVYGAIGLAGAYVLYSLFN